MSEIKILTLFIDGIGIGYKNRFNPFYIFKSKYFGIFRNEPVLPEFNLNTKRKIYTLDTLLGVNGLPQSATGQTSLFTGINAPLLKGKKHITGFPDKELRKLLYKNNILLTLKKQGLKVKFINCYPLFEKELSKGYLKLNKEGEFIIKGNIDTKILKRISATTIMALSISQKFMGINELINKKCVYHDFTNQLLIEQKINVPKFTPEIAAEILIKSLSEYDFVLYEYFLTDRIGHKKDFREAKRVVQLLDKFIDYLTKNLNLSNTYLIIISDHGNFEDLSKTTHTYNKVPLIVFGKNFSYSFLPQSLLDFPEFISHLILKSGK